jgi:hypothetical protein
MIKRKLERYLQILSNIDSDQDKFVWIMDFGKNSMPMDKEHKAQIIRSSWMSITDMVSAAFC